jgi:hypothetical protein
MLAGPDAGHQGPKSAIHSEGGRGYDGLEDVDSQSFLASSMAKLLTSQDPISYLLKG